MNHLRYFAKLLLQYKRYYISNAMIVENDARYRISSYQYSWTLNNKTLVEEYVDSIPITLPCEFEFTDFSTLYKHADTDRMQSKLSFLLPKFTYLNSLFLMQTTNIFFIFHF